MKRVLLKVIGDCEVHQVSELLAFALAREMDRTDSKALGWHLYDFAETMTTVVSELKQVDLKEAFEAMSYLLRCIQKSCRNMSGNFERNA